MEEDRKLYASHLESEKGRLLDRERNAGLLEGQVHAVSAEASMLRDQVRETERSKGQFSADAERLRQELEAAKNDFSIKQKEQSAEYERKLVVEREKAEQKKGCMVWPRAAPRPGGTRG